MFLHHVSVSASLKLITKNIFTIFINRYNLIYLWYLIAKVSTYQQGKSFINEKQIEKRRLKVLYILNILNSKKSISLQ